MQRILLIRLSAIGDIVFASPIIHALRQRYPEAHIAWLMEPPTRELLVHHPELDEVIVWPKAQWKAMWKARQFRQLFRAIRFFSRDLKAHQFDTAIDMQGLLKSGIWAKLSRAPRRIGLGSREGSQYLMTECIAKAGDEEMIGSEYRHLAESLGLETRPFPMRVQPDQAAQKIARQLIETHNLANGFAVFCPFTTRPQKHWFNDAWRALVPKIRESFDLPVVLLGGPGDQAAAAEIAQSLPVIDLTGKTSLLQAAALISHSSLLIGVDTGLTHLGTAYERPTICLFGSTRPYLKTESRKTAVIYHNLPCSPCRRSPTCHGKFTCLREITADEVLDTASEVMAR